MPGKTSHQRSAPRRNGRLICTSRLGPMFSGSVSRRAAKSWAIARLPSPGWRRFDKDEVSPASGSSKGLATSSFMMGGYRRCAIFGGLSPLSVRLSLGSGVGYTRAYQQLGQLSTEGSVTSLTSRPSSSSSDSYCFCETGLDRPLRAVALHMPAVTFPGAGQGCCTLLTSRLQNFVTHVH